MTATPGLQLNELNHKSIEMRMTDMRQLMEAFLQGDSLRGSLRVLMECLINTELS